MNRNHFLQCATTTQLWQLFTSLAGIVWVTPQDTFDLICSWDGIDGTTNHKECGRLFHLAYGGQFGKRGTQDILKARAAQFRRSSAPAFLF